MRVVAVLLLSMLLPSFALAQWCGPDGCAPQQRIEQTIQMGNVSRARCAGGLGSCTALKKTSGGYYLGLCDHQTRDDPEHVEILIGQQWRMTRVVWRSTAHDAAIVFLPACGVELNVATACEGNSLGQTVTMWGFSGGVAPLRFVQGRCGLSCFQGTVPAFMREGMSGGPVYSPTGCLVGIFNGYQTQNISINLFTQAKIYYAAITEIESLPRETVPPIADAPLVPVPDPQPTPASDITIIRGEMHQLSVDIKAQIAAIPHGAKGAKGDKGDAGPPGADGKSVTALELQAAVAAWMAAHPQQAVDITELTQRVAALEEQIEEPFDVQLFSDGKPVTDVRSVKPHGGWLPINMPLQRFEFRNGEYILVKEQE